MYAHLGIGGFCSKSVHYAMLLCLRSFLSCVWKAGK